MNVCRALKSPDVLDSPAAVWEFTKRFYEGTLQEKFVCFALNSKNHVAGWHDVSVGTISETIVHPREVFRGAVYCNAASVIVTHNHPSGMPDPSREDISVTKRLVEAGKVLGIKVLDHVIVTDEDFFSMRENGYMEEAGE